MSLEPRPSTALNHIAESCAEGFPSNDFVRVTVSQAAAPARNWSMSNPCSAAGRRPTADVSLVRPPTQSHIGNR